MLDPDEVAQYEAWRQDKLVSETDLSPHAYNVEMESQALAYEKGVDDVMSSTDVIGELTKVETGLHAERFKADNPYRAKGMRGERKITS